jgi:hypothetical protein
MLECLDEPEPAEKPESFRRQIAHLRIGDSCAKVRRIPLDSPDAHNLTEETRRFRLSIDSEVSKQRKSSGRDYAVEQGTIITGAGHVLIVVSVTRQ